MPAFLTTHETHFGRGPSLQLRLFLAVIISIAAIVADSRFGVFSHVRVYLSSLVSPLQYMANAPGIMLDTMSTQVQTRAGLIEQTKQQEQQLFTLRSRLLKMDHLEHENHACASCWVRRCTRSPARWWPSCCQWIPTPSAIRC